MNDLKSYDDVKEQNRINRVLAVLCFLDFALIGYLLTQYLLF